MRCSSRASSSSGQVYIWQSITITSERLSVNIFASESAFWNTARFLLAAVSRFIGSLKLKIVDSTNSLNSRVFPPWRKRNETGYLQPSFDHTMVKVHNMYYIFAQRVDFRWFPGRGSGPITWFTEAKYLQQSESNMNPLFLRRSFIPDTSFSVLSRRELQNSLSETPFIFADFD